MRGLLYVRMLIDKGHNQRSVQEEYGNIEGRRLYYLNIISTLIERESLYPDFWHLVDTGVLTFEDKAIIKMGQASVAWLKSGREGLSEPMRFKFNYFLNN